MGKKKGNKKVNYSLDDLKNKFKYIYLTDKEMYAMKTEMPFNDNDTVYVFEYKENYTNKHNVWFRSTELEVA